MLKFAWEDWHPHTSEAKIEVNNRWIWWEGKGDSISLFKFCLGSAGEPTICSHCYDVLNEDVWLLCLWLAMVPIFFKCLTPNDFFLLIRKLNNNNISLLDMKTNLKVHMTMTLYATLSTCAQTMQYNNHMHRTVQFIDAWGGGLYAV